MGLGVKEVASDAPRKGRELRPDPLLVVAVQDYLMNNYGMTRPPPIAGRVLALVIELARTNQVFPRREELAKLFKCSIFAIDAALYVAQTRELITQHSVTLANKRNTHYAKAHLQRRRFLPTAKLRAGVERRLHGQLPLGKE